ncbi:MAG: DinB family protein [Promethearchaeota archaeon]
MSDQLIKDLSSGINGFLTHLEPMKAVEGLAPLNARKKPLNKYHSCWELLHHTVYWQDILLKHLDGKTIDWSKLNPEDNWPTNEYLSRDENFIELVKRFKKNLELAATKLEKVDLMKGVKIGSEHTPDVTYFRLFLVFLQHTSYHLGQMVTTRKLLGEWKED